MYIEREEKKIIAYIDFLIKLVRDVPLTLIAIINFLVDVSTSQTERNGLAP